MADHNRFDVIVAGAGVFGAWSAFSLRRAGAKVLLLDAYGPANSRASSGGESRIIRMGYGPDEIYTLSAQRSLKLWQNLFEANQAAATDQRSSLFHKTGVLWLAREPDEYSEATLATLRRLNIGIEYLNRKDLELRYPQLQLDSIDWGMLEPDSGVLMGRQAVRAVVSEAISNGVSYRCDCVLPPPARGKLAAIVTVNGDKIFADNFVFACGPWLPKIFPELLGNLIHVTRQEVFFFGVPGGSTEFSPPAMPVWIDFTELVYAIPDLESRGFKIAIDAHGAEFDPDSEDRTVSVRALDAVRPFLAKRMPKLADAPVLESRICQYENTGNGDFLLDRHPDTENVFIVGGGSGHGFKHGPAVGEYVVGLVSGGHSLEERFTFARRNNVRQREVF